MKTKMYTAGRSERDFAKAMMQRYSIESLDFRFSTEEHVLITFPKHTTERSEILKSIIRSPRPLIVDAFACIGADTMALMADFPRASIFAVQRTGSEKELDRFKRLTHNTALFNDAFCSGSCSLVTVPLDIERFLPNVRKRIDLLYIDPPWGDDTGLPYADQDVCDYAVSILALAQKPPRAVVMKLRPAIEAKLRGYVLARSLEVTSRKGSGKSFYFHVFVRR